MKKSNLILGCAAMTGVALLGLNKVFAEDAAPTIPRFSIDNMDKSVDPGADFYHYAAGTWLKENPVPEDKPRWAAFDQLQQRNLFLIHEIMESAASDSAAPPHSPRREVGDLFASAMDTNRINELGLKPLSNDFAKIDAIKTTDDLMRLAAEFQLRNVNVFFETGGDPDEKNSDLYALHFGQGGLGLPDRDYYLNKDFLKQLQGYVIHIATMMQLAGEPVNVCMKDSLLIMSLETEMARASKSRTDLRDPVANYHKFTTAELLAKYPGLGLQAFLDASGVSNAPYAIVGQPEYFEALDRLIKERPIDEWKVYLRWHVLHSAAPFLPAALEDESFKFYGTTLSGQPVQEPRWQRSVRKVDAAIGEASGQLFVEKYYPPAARARMNALIEDLKSVLHDRLQRVPWMTEATRAKALVKFAALTQKIGYPDKFRDYSKVEIRRDDYLGNMERAMIFESRRELDRIGQPVDKTEWQMTPQTVNAYFNPLQNEIVFPAGILQPPFFDVSLDDAVNYGGIGAVIGHEMTHSYDDEGRKFDEHGNLNEWWTDEDAKAFEARAQKLVDQYNAYEALPGVHVNGKLTLGENIADLGGLSIAYEALQRDLARDPSKRKNIDGFTPEQRFFLSFSQVWRMNCRDTEVRRRITTDPHSPGQFRAVGPAENLQQFYDAFGIKEGAPEWRAPDLRAVIW